LDKLQDIGIVDEIEVVELGQRSQLLLGLGLELHELAVELLQMRVELMD